MECNFQQDNKFKFDITFLLAKRIKQFREERKKKHKMYMRKKEYQ